MAPTLEALDAALAQWRDRLAAASRNVSELSELPEYSVAKQAACGTGRIAEEARHLAATVDELWQGVLLIGAALDRAEAARARGSRLWRGPGAAAEAMAILDGPSVTVDLAETPVLHRRLLAGPRATATVSPGTLLETMEHAFDRARERLERITEAARRADALSAHLAALALPGPLAAQLAAATQPDPLDRLEALEAVRPAIEAAAAAVARGRAGLQAARTALAALAEAEAQANAAATRARAATTAALPPGTAALPELAAWLDRLGQTLAAGRVSACAIGLGNWLALHDRAAAETAALANAATAALARCHELRARFGGLRAKHRARPAPHADPTAAQAALDATPMDLDAAAAALHSYGAALARPG